MTNYNERLEEIAVDLWAKYGRPGTMDEFVREAKQVLTSLTKEMVAEAKPEIKAHQLGPVTLADCQRGLNHYEANILKALEEK